MSDISPATDPHYRSDCHNAAVYVVGTDEGTNYYECATCKEGCDYHSAMTQTTPASGIPDLPEDSIREPESSNPSPSQGLLKAVPASGAYKPCPICQGSGLEGGEIDERMYA